MGFFDKLKEGLSKTRNAIFDGLFGVERIDDDFYDEIEEAMIVADIGVRTTQKLMEMLKTGVTENKLKTKDEAKEYLIKCFADIMRPDSEFIGDEPAVVLIIGVNGVGKTTSIGKLAHIYKQKDRKVILAAADTFRAAAAEQLTVWADRNDVPIVKHNEGADPAAVVFDAIAKYKAKNMDMLICDTAGRLHNKVNLMKELNKIRRVIERELPDTKCEVLLVIDATTGQNAIVQAKAFGEATGLTGIIITKLDGTARGGVALAVKEELGIPVRFIGVGEGIEDMQEFVPEEFAKALI
ncbi:MAG: signal recognition particle-docking protein FtsY [Eubacteriales bacterium]|nr:signal recognition particle-docking protein FtsY [Eubacteriales bacterium]MCI7571040.1 signal recognition particle-docking protein FtsY [Clostridiales bacterium]MDD7550157.1 signal recognition particle-docking protein FtsY [Clostridia bacterium]MDY5754851.1 signal recognition particle-docking protein FtsY [Eubacteriales bacterium]